MTTTARKRAVIYCRVSTDKQEQDGESLDYQEAKCRQYAELHDNDVIAVLKEVRSGFIHYSFREQLTLARQFIRDMIADTVIVWDLRRFSRNFVHSAMIFAEIEGNGGSIISVSENIDNSLTGKLIRSILAWSAESEREKIMEYANRRWQTRVELGLPVGSGYPPYGWQWGDKEKTCYTIDQEEAAVRFSIFHMYVELDMSLRAISHKLTEDGVATPTQLRQPNSRRGTLWNHTTIYDYLRDPGVIGQLTICKRQNITDDKGRARHQPHPDKKVIEGGLPAIVSRTLYDRAQAKLALNQVELSHEPEDPTKHLLRGHIRCGTCGRRMCSRTMTHKGGGSKPYYYCTNRRNKFGKCPDIPVVRADLVDAIAWAECCHLFERLDLIQAKIDQEVERSLTELLEDTRGAEQLAALRAAVAYAKAEQAKHPKDSYYYNLTGEDVRIKTEQLQRYEAEMGNTRSLAVAMAAYRQRVIEFLEFINVMRGSYHEAPFQKKRNALDVLGMTVRVRALPPEQRHRGIEPTVESLRERVEITYSPLFTGVEPSGEGLPQNQ